MKRIISMLLVLAMVLSVALMAISCSKEEKKEVYVPRPAWQVWSARIALVVFILFLIMYYINILRGNG